MLEVLKIRNIALIAMAEVSFKPGLNIISGETGAGKSILLEAIALILGGRASHDLIRAGCEEAQVEGLFDLTDLPFMHARLARLGFKPTASELLIKRLVHRSGKHRIWINGELATLSLLQQLAEGLVDLCSQHEHQSLLKPWVQLELLDRYGESSELAASVIAQYGQWKALEREKEALKKLQSEQLQRADFLSFQIREIREAQLSLGEEEQLTAEKRLLHSAEVRGVCADSALKLLEGDEGGGVLQALQAALQKVRQLKQLDVHVTVIFESLERGLVETEDACLALSRYAHAVEVHPERLQMIQDRLTLMGDLQKKYGPQLADVLTFLQQLEQDFESLENVGARLEQCQKRSEEGRVELEAAAERLSQRRQQAQVALGQAVTQELQDLNMEGAQVLVELTHASSLREWTNASRDQVQLLIQTNPGEPARSLAKIISGGELSRLMLAFRRVVTHPTGIGVYLFDEIDAGMGGSTAFEVGKKLKLVSSNHQVLCITHLPQVAAFADHHLRVAKKVAGQRTRTEILELAPEKRLQELARMLGGPALTAASLASAGELVELAQRAKSSSKSTPKRAASSARRRSPPSPPTTPADPTRAPQSPVKKSKKSQALATQSGSGVSTALAPRSRAHFSDF